ncbi:hypothetical protein GCM10027511_13320 [Hymenobacter humi]
MAAGIEVTDAESEASDWYQQVIGSTQLVLMLMAFIALVLWAYRAYENLHRLHKSPEPRHSEGAAGWGWFIPIISFWYPYQVMKDIWYLTQRYSQSNDYHDYERSDNVIGGWWALRIFTIFASRGLSAPTQGTTTIAQIQEYMVFLLCMDVLHIWYALATVYLLKKFRPFEQRLAARFANDEPENAEELPAAPAPL